MIGCVIMLETILLIVSVILIAIVLLQSGKASDAGQIITGGADSLFQQTKERGIELWTNLRRDRYKLQ